MSQPKTLLDLCIEEHRYGIKDCNIPRNMGLKYAKDMRTGFTNRIERVAIVGVNLAAMFARQFLHVS